MIKLKRTDLLYPELSYQINGILFKIFKTIGYGFQEKYYQRAVEEELKLAKLNFKREAFVPIEYNNRKIGRYHMDFVIENKIVLELKVTNDFYEDHISQVLAYLKSSGLKLGILARITPKGVKIKRIVL